MRPPAWLLVAALAGIVGRAAAQDETPDLSFLEYLGSWDEGDEEWLVIVEIETDVAEPDEQDEASDTDEENDGKPEED